jgi:hypothetical protein
MQVSTRQSNHLSPPTLAAHQRWKRADYRYASGRRILNTEVILSQLFDIPLWYALMVPSSPATFGSLMNTEFKH